MAARKRKTSVRSYGLYRHDGGASTNGELPLATTYAAFDNKQLNPVVLGSPMIFYNDFEAQKGENWPSDGFVSNGAQLINDGATSIFFSLDGIWDTFELRAGENILFDWIKEQQMWLRGAVAGTNYRLIVW